MSDRCEECGGSITPHPEARETDTGFSVTSEEYLAQIDAAVARGDAPAYMAEMLRKALAAGGSPTTTPESNTSPENLDSSGETQADLDAPTTTPTTEPTEQQVVAGALCYHRDRHAYQEYGMVSPWIIMVCRDCGAKVSAGFNTQLPDMPPMPYPPEDQQVEEKQCEPTNEQLEAAKAVLLPSLIRDPERGSLSSCVTLIRLALRASLSVGGSITPADQETPDILAQMADDVAAFDALPEDIKRQTKPIWPLRYPANQEDTDETV